MLHAFILDGYVDEPTCLGVPPYISPYPRYIAGAVWDHDPHAIVSYATIDQIRRTRSILKDAASSDLLVVIAGMAVPGRYLSGFPASPHELISFLNTMSKPVKLLCGPAARYGFGMAGGRPVIPTDVVTHVFDLIVKGDGEIVVSELLKKKLNIDKVDPSLCRTNPHEIKDFAIRGAAVVTQHPFFPTYLITEIETYRGCSRSITGGCSFCSESRKGEQEFPRPNPEALKQLFRGIRQVAPELKTLHIDNANPGVIARYPEECRQIAQTIIQYHTAGDVAALGVESVDPVVIKKNNLKASAEEVYKVVQLFNEVGARLGTNGLPELLPGLNFVFGLEGETKETFRLDYEFLKKISDEGLLLRRINLRQVIPIPGTRMFETGEKNIRKHKAEFQRFKRKVRETIERPMLHRMLPPGTLLTQVYAEAYEGKLTFARQLGSYPLLVGIPGVYPLHRFYDVKIVDYGYRSLTAVPFPLDMNTAPRETLEALPGIGKKRAVRLLVQRPFHSRGEVLQAIDDPTVAKNLQPYLSGD
jgi:radical SAM superfamily enzyme with C-terminal helix-hairpin-helix motif